MDGGNVYAIKRIRHVKKSLYNEESYRKALEDDRIKELLKTDSFMCEYFSSDIMMSKTFRHNLYRINTIDLTNACAKIIEIYDDVIIIKLLDNKIGNHLKDILETDINSVRAHMRSNICSKKENRNKRIIKNIITFDIVHQ